MTVHSRELRQAGHPSLDTLTRFAQGAASGAEAMEVVAHLLRLCPVCAMNVSSLVRPPVEQASYDLVLEKVAERVRASEALR
jgi:hypothetical protein